MKDVWAGNAEEAQRDITGRHLVCELAVRAVRWLFVLLLKGTIHSNFNFHLHAETFFVYKYMYYMFTGKPFVQV